MRCDDSLSIHQVIRKVRAIFIMVYYVCGCLCIVKQTDMCRCTGTVVFRASVLFLYFQPLYHKMSTESDMF